MKFKIIMILFIMIFSGCAFSEPIYASQDIGVPKLEGLKEVSQECPKEGLLPFRFKNWSLLSGTLLGAASCSESPFMPEGISQKEYGFLARKLTPYPYLRRAFLTINLKKHSLSKYILISDRVIQPKSTTSIYFICPFEHSKVSIIQSASKKSKNNISLNLAKSSELDKNLLPSISQIDRSNMKVLSDNLILNSTEQYVLTVSNSANTPLDYAMIIEFSSID